MDCCGCSLVVFVDFVEEQELRDIWSGGKSADGDDAAERDDPKPEVPADRPVFEIVNLAVDRRMLVNRQRKLKMYRCWMQGLFRKPAEISTMAVKPSE